jgi:hypothetical protein
MILLEKISDTATLKMDAGAAIYASKVRRVAAEWVTNASNSWVTAEIRDSRPQRHSGRFPV